MSRRRLTRVGYNAAAVLVLLVTVFPIYWMVATGFKRGSDILSFEPRWLPIPGTLENYRSAVGKPHFLQDVGNSLVVVWGALPFVAITVHAGLTQVPAELEEAARVDGAGPWQVFRHITFPVLKPIFLILATLSTIWDFKVFTQIWVMLNQRPSREYFLLGIWSYSESFGVTRYGKGAAIAVVMVLLLLGLTFFYVRQMLKAVGP